MKDQLKLVPILFFIFITLWLRFANLGYSDYQGDEIKALWRPEAGQSAIDFLYMQKKGPTEFLVTYMMSFFDPTFSNEFLQRLPFAVAGVLGVFCFYQFVKMHYGNKIAVYATLLLSINGIFIGLFRIIQYQPFVFLFSVLALIFFTLALQEERWKITGIYAGVAFWTAALFSHWDGVFIAPIAFYILILWYGKYDELASGTRLRHLLIPFVASGLFLAAYFVPYFLSLPSNTMNYWTHRFVGHGESDTRLSSSILNFDLYNPILGLYLYPILVLLSLPKMRKIYPVVIWFVISWVILELVIYDPGTHIYAYLMPAIILCSFGLEVLEEVILKIAGNTWGKRLNVLGLSLLFIALAGISHLIFIDHTPEYPYEKRGILFWTIGGDKENYSLRAFGFPYYRRWEDIREYVATHDTNGFYATNEDTSISDYYVLPNQYYVKRAGYYIHVYNPQSFRTAEGAKKKLSYWRENYEPERIYEYNGRVVAEIYYMPEGGLEEIKDAGY